MTLQTDLPVLVYDVGGSHVSAALCQQNSLTLGPVLRSGSPLEISAEAFFQTLYSLGVQAAEDVSRVGGAQLAVPAPFDYETGISRMTHKLPYLYGVDLRGALAALFGWHPEQVRFLHDSAAFVLGEFAAGAARGAQRAVGITRPVARFGTCPAGMGFWRIFFPPGQSSANTNGAQDRIAR